MRFLVFSVYSAAQKLARLSSAASSQMISSYSTSRPQRHVPSNNSSMTIRKYCQSPEAVTVDFNQVKKATEDGKILIVDVREPDEVKEYGKIENSINIPCIVTTVLGTVSEKEFENIYKRPKPNEETEIIFYCMIGKRSGMAQQNALSLGYKNAKNYLGSWLDWASKTQGK